MIGHSTGGGEVARFIGRHGTARVSKAVLMGAVPPLMLKTEANPGGLPIEVFDGFRTAYLADRSQFFLDVASGPFFGFNRPGAKVSQGLIQSWWLQGMMSGHKNAYDCIKAFSETDFTEDLRKFDVPTLIIRRVVGSRWIGSFSWGSREGRIVTVFDLLRDYDARCTAGVAQWQSAWFPTTIRGFDSLHPLSFPSP
jgi:hypothetical protein